MGGGGGGGGQIQRFSHRLALSRRLAFDMFSSLFYGVQMKTSSPSARHRLRVCLRLGGFGV